MSRDKEDIAVRIALFRHRLIARLLPTDLSARQRQQEIARIVAEEHQIPESLRTRVARTTLGDWLRDYRAGGFDALKPSTRIDAGHPRALAPAVAERLLQIKETEPDLSIRLIIKQLQEEANLDTPPHLPISTVHRLFKSHGLMSPRGSDSSVGEDRRRFAYREAGQLWMSDVMHSPPVVGDNTRRKSKSYLIAFIDDATRVITHAEFAFGENTRSFLPVFKRALMRRGIPQRLYVDNGSNYRSHHFSVVCAKLGIALIHARPYQPEGKGKIERFFRTCRAQLIARLDESDTASLEAMNRRLAGWIEGEYHQSPHRGIDGQTPLERWAEVGGSVRYPDPQLDLDDLFLFEEERKVQSDRTVSLHGRVFEVDPSLIRQRVTLRYDPSRPDASVQVVHEGKFIEQARQVDLYANCHVKRHRRTGALEADGDATPTRSSLSMRSLDKDAGNGDTDGGAG